MEADIDITNYFRGICRACTKKHKELFPLFGGAKIKFGDKCFTISEILFLAGRVKTDADDILPKHVCRKCLTRLIEIFSFQLKCIESDVKFKNLFSNSLSKSIRTPSSSQQNEVVIENQDAEGVVIKEEKDEFEPTTLTVQSLPDCEKIVKSTELENTNNKSPNNMSSISDIIVSILEDKDQQLSVSMTVTLNDKNPGSRQISEIRPVQEVRPLNESLSIGNTSKSTNCSFNANLNQRNDLDSDKKQGKFICTFCKDSFDTWSDLGKHIFEHKALNNYGRLREDSPKSLDSSSIIENQEKILCEPYPEKFYSAEGFEDHINIQHNGNYENADQSKFPKLSCNDIRLSILSEQEVSLSGSYSDANDDRYRCDFCPASYKYKCDYLRHLREKHIEQYPNKEKYKCSMCDKLFIYRLECTRHEKEHEKSREKAASGANHKYKCLLCNTIFSKFLYIQKHLIVTHKTKKTDFAKSFKKILNVKPLPCKGTFKCSECGKNFLKYLEMIKHKEKCNAGNSSNSSEQDESMQDSFSVRKIKSEADDNTEKSLTPVENNEILANAKSPKYGCGKCSSNYTRYYDLKKHLRAKHNLKKDSEAEKFVKRLFKCPLCPANYSHNKSLRYHLKNKHRITPKNKLTYSHRCTWCDRSFYTAGHLKMHNLSKHANSTKPTRPSIEHKKTGAATYKCKLCETECVSYFGWKSHTINEHSQNSASLSYRCQHCNKTFMRQHSLNSHLKTHEIINASSKSEKALNSPQTSLTQSEDTHNSNSIYKCLICPSIFSSNGNLRRHYRNIHPDRLEQHEKEKTENDMYQCMSCQRWFNRSSHLKLHARRHIGDSKEGVSDIHCEFCNRTFKTTKEYGFHLMMHRADAKRAKRYCQECFIIFENEKGYNIHMTNKHRLN